MKYVLYSYISTCHSVCVQCPILPFFVVSFFLVCCLHICLSDFEMVPVTPVITGITFAFTFHMQWISVVRFLFFKIFSASFLITFLLSGIAPSIKMHVPFLWSQIMMSSWLLGIVLSVRIFWLHNMVTLPLWLVLADFGAWSYQCSLSNFTSISLYMLKCSWAHTISCLFMYCSFANIGHADMMCSTVSSNCL